jgi:CBS domain-containing protein
MVDSNLHTLPVVEEDKLVGVIGKEDVLRTLIKGDRGH